MPTVSTVLSAGAGVATTLQRAPRASSRRPFTSLRPQRRLWQQLARAEGESSSEQATQQVGSAAGHCARGASLSSILCPAPRQPSKRAGSELRPSRIARLTVCALACAAGAGAGGAAGCASAACGSAAARSNGGGANLGAARTRAGGAEGGGCQPGPAVWRVPPLLLLCGHCGGEAAAECATLLPAGHAQPSHGAFALLHRAHNAGYAWPSGRPLPPLCLPRQFAPARRRPLPAHHTQSCLHTTSPHLRARRPAPSRFPHTTTATTTSSSPPTSLTQPLPTGWLRL